MKGNKASLDHIRKSFLGLKNYLKSVLLVQKAFPYSKSLDNQQILWFQLDLLAS